VSERIAPIGTDSIPLDDASWQRVSSKYIVVDLVGYIVGGLIATGVSLVPLVALDWSLGWIPPILVGIVALVIVAVTPARVRSIGYQLRQDDLLFRRGIAWQKFVSVPYGRMQLVDITRGPLARVLGLSELRFVTAAASSTVVIPGITQDQAEKLRDQLVELAESRRAGL
jgi:membrane protein YdbS with pleckstrin-like domain